VKQPEGRIPDMGLFVLEPEDGDSDVVEQGRAVDLVRGVLNGQFLNPGLDGAERGQVLPHTGRVVLA
jgi:hypothetical protein